MVINIMLTQWGCRAMLVDAVGRIRWVEASSHSTDDRWCIACLSMSDQSEKQNVKIGGDNTKAVRIQMTHETYQRMVIMCRERDMSADFLIHTLLWDAKEGGICRDQDE